MKSNSLFKSIVGLILLIGILILIAPVNEAAVVTIVGDTWVEDKELAE